MKNFGKKCATIALSMICRRKQGGKWTQGITPGMMRKISWVDPVFSLPGEIRGVDPRCEIARAGFSRPAGRQGAGRSETRNARLTNQAGAVTPPTTVPVASRAAAQTVPSLS